MVSAVQNSICNYFYIMYWVKYFSLPLYLVLICTDTIVLGITKKEETKNVSPKKAKNQEEGTCSANNKGKDCSKEKKESSKGYSPLHLAVGSNDEEQVEKILKSDKKDNMINALGGGDFGHTPLHLAAAKGRLKLMRMLIDAGADVNAYNKVGETPLTACAVNGQTLAAEMLIKHGADVEKPGELRRTPLLQAAIAGSTQIVELLLAKGANIEARDSERESNSLHLAAYFGNNDVIKVLLDRKPDLINSLSSFGRSALHAAAMAGRLETVKLLLERGIDHTMVDTQYDSAFALAYRSGHTDMVNYFKQQGIRK